MLLLIFLCGLCYAATIQPTTSLTVEVTELKNNKGQILVSVFNQTDGFPRNTDKAFKKVAVPIATNGTATVLIENLPQGKYAIAIAHDENRNYKMDYNRFNFPLEGYGFSNDARGTMSAPTFAAATFRLASASATIRIKTSYFSAGISTK